MLCGYLYSSRQSKGRAGGDDRWREININEDLSLEYVQFEGGDKHFGTNIFINRELTLKKTQKESKPRITDNSAIGLFIFTLRGIVIQWI